MMESSELAVVTSGRKESSLPGAFRLERKEIKKG